MKNLYRILWGIMMMAATNSASATELKVKVNNIEIKRGGAITVMVFGAAGFPKKHAEAIEIKTNNVLSETMTFSFDLDIDELAVKVLHDENEDGKVTKNWTGIYPKEGLGFSNDQKIGMTGPPRYKKSKLSRDVFKNELVIAVIYP